jgi:hypothetical protein
MTLRLAFVLHKIANHLPAVDHWQDHLSEKPEIPFEFAAMDHSLGDDPGVGIPELS